MTAQYDWNKFGHPRVALFNRVMAWFATCMAVVMVPFLIILSLQDWTIAFAALMFTAAAAVMQTGLRVIYRAEKPRPDYTTIAAMELPIWGRTFEHAGAPQRAVSRPESRWDGRTTHPDTTQPATIEDYVLWLQGYVKRGGKLTHFYDYPFGQVGFRYASSKLTVDSDYEYGSSLRQIIVAKDVTTQRTNPAGPFDGWAHTSCYFMHGYRTNKSIVPVYSDPEFDEFRSSAPR